ncbi:hypothetical protein HYC85_013937 [Camellia sinensis]|uniref:Uncharacterized protein n=1 Tax=Camellia sinensis TaxID=4442 RepID=A0A7J7H4T9_CAMSI|nr:hypothetical protein HYC85_013937 [Camellia sinensis]
MDCRRTHGRWEQRRSRLSLRRCQHSLGARKNTFQHLEWQAKMWESELQIKQPIAPARNTNQDHLGITLLETSSISNATAADNARVMCPRSESY